MSWVGGASRALPRPVGHLIRSATWHTDGYDLCRHRRPDRRGKRAAQAAYFGKRVACVERADEPGGAAVHTGTLPSKTLRETAIFLSGFRQRELYGLSVEMNPDLVAAGSFLSRKNAGPRVRGRPHPLEPRAPQRASPSRRGAISRPAHDRALGRRRRAATRDERGVPRGHRLAPAPSAEHPLRRRFYDIDDHGHHPADRPAAEDHGGGGRRRHRVRVRLDLRRHARPGHAHRGPTAPPLVPRYRGRRAPSRRDAGARRHLPPRAHHQDHLARAGAGHRHRARRRPRRDRCREGSSPRAAARDGRRASASKGSGVEVDKPRLRGRSTRLTGTTKANIYMRLGDVIGFPALASRTSMDQARVSRVPQQFGFE